MSDPVGPVTDRSWPTALVLNAIRSDRLGSESKVTHRALLGKDKCRPASLAYPTAVPRGPRRSPRFTASPYCEACFSRSTRSQCAIRSAGCSSIALHGMPTV